MVASVGDVATDTTISDSDLRTFNNGVLCAKSDFENSTATPLALSFGF